MGQEIEEIEGDCRVGFYYWKRGVSGAFGFLQEREGGKVVCGAVWYGSLRRRRESQVVSL